MQGLSKYAPGVHLVDDFSACRENSTELRRTERKPDIELNRQLIKGHRFFDDPYGMPESAELIETELVCCADIIGAC